MTEKESAPAPEKKKAATKEPGQMTHHIIRTISKQATASRGGAQMLADIEAYIADYTMNGWKLFSTHYLGELPEGYTVLWVLTKDL